MRIRGLLLVPVLVSLLACDKPPTPPAPAPAASAPSPSHQPTKVKREPAADLDTKHLAESMKCSPKSKNGCIALSSFDAAGKWNLTNIRSDEARYFGKAWFHKGGEVTEAWAFLVVKKVPLSEVQAGDLPIKVALCTMDDAPPTALAHTEKLFRILQNEGAVNKLNNAAEHVKRYVPAKWDGGTQTRGVSSVLFMDAGAFVRESDNRALHVVKAEVRGPGRATGDGMLASLYPLTW